MKPRPPTHMMTPKKNNSVSHSTRDTSRKLSNGVVSPISPYSFLSNCVVVVGFAQVVAEKLENGETGHHAEKRRQVQKVVERHGESRSCRRRAL